MQQKPHNLYDMESVEDGSERAEETKRYKDWRTMPEWEMKCTMRAFIVTPLWLWSDKMFCVVGTLYLPIVVFFSLNCTRNFSTLCGSLLLKSYILFSCFLSNVKHTKYETYKIKWTMTNGERRDVEKIVGKKMKSTNQPDVQQD